MRSTSPALAAAIITILAAPAEAAYPTRVLTAVEKVKTLPDVQLGVGFDTNSRRARITREWVQDEGGTRVAQDVKELDFEELTQRLVLELRVGLYRDLEFHVQAPVVLRNDSNIAFADGVEGRSTIWGSPNANDPNSDFRFPITDVPASRHRSGFGDMTFGLSWAPFVDFKDEAYPTMTLRGDIVVPTGKVRDPVDQDALPGGPGGGVGLGQTIFDLSLGFSKRGRPNAPTLDPYLLLGARIPVATPKQRERGLEPPPSGYFVVGSEVVIHDDADKAERYALDVSFGFQYIGTGRTYSMLSDYLPNFDQTRAPANRGGNIPEDHIGYSDYANPANYNTRIDGTRCGLVAGVPCGELNRVDEHLRMTGVIAMHIQPVRYFLIRSGFGLGFTSDHLLTTERVGTDLDPPDSTARCPAEGGLPCHGRVNARNAQGVDERSRFYDPRYDQPGRRFRAEAIVDLTFFVSAAATF